MASVVRRLAGLAVLTCVSCTSVGVAVSDDARLDESPEPQTQAAGKRARSCGPDGPGDVVLLDARTASPVTCQSVTLTREPMRCNEGEECASDVVFQGLSGPTGLVKLTGPVQGARLVAAADGYGPSSLPNATLTAGQVLELELTPDTGFWLKLLDADGTYLPDVDVTFSAGGETLAQLHSNALANVFFSQRQPFSGLVVTVTAKGFQPATVQGAADLGDDGHTLTLRR